MSGDFNTKDRVLKMVEAIRTEAKDKSQQINENSMMQHKIEKNKILMAQREKINQEYLVKMEQYSVQKRIQKSAKVNSCRLKGMNKRSEFLNELKDELNGALLHRLKDKNIYKKLLKNLIIQALIKMMEPEVELKCLKKDFDIVKSIVEEAALEFSNLCQKEIGKEFFTKINMNTEHFLPDSKVGGVLISSLRGRIVCSNTLESRLDLAFAESLPIIRSTLFPSSKSKKSK